MSLAANTNQLINGSLLTIHSPDLSGKTSTQWVGDQNGGHMRTILTVPMFVFIASQGWGWLARSIPDSRLLRSIHQTRVLKEEEEHNCHLKSQDVFFVNQFVLHLGI